MVLSSYLLQAVLQLSESFPLQDSTNWILCFTVLLRVFVNKKFQRHVILTLEQIFVQIKQVRVPFNLDPVVFLKKAKKQNWDFIFGALPQLHEVIQLHPCRAQIVVTTRFSKTSRIILLSSI